MTAKVLLDLNLPAFQDDLLALEPSEVRLVLTTLRKLRTLDWASVYRDPGLKWEQIEGHRASSPSACPAAVAPWCSGTVTTSASSPCTPTMMRPTARSALCAGRSGRAAQRSSPVEMLGTG